VAAYCDVVVKLSDTLQWLPGRCLVRNVHGVRPDFLAIGARRATLGGAADDDGGAAAAAATPHGAVGAASPPDEEGEHSARKGAYFLAKALWAKGYRELVDFTGAAAGAGGGALAGVEIACYGSGPDAAAIRAEAEARGCPLRFHGAIDHAHESLYGYHVFVNPSTSEVLCTATAEALAMGKIVVVPEHPSNEFFKAFQNCAFFQSEADFGRVLAAALAATPEPLTAVERYTLSWEVRHGRELRSESSGWLGRCDVPEGWMGSHACVCARVCFCARARARARAARGSSVVAHIPPSPASVPLLLTPLGRLRSSA
jgi:digalactosyldiacylglycerol synthase